MSKAGVVSDNPIKTSVDDINTKRGRSQGWPACFEYSYDASARVCKLDFFRDFEKKSFRRIDPWAFAFVESIERSNGDKVDKITFRINCDKACKNRQHCKGVCPNMEALRRRVSFLQLNNKDIEFSIWKTDMPVRLYSTKTELFDRPHEEVIRSKYDKRSDQDSPGRIEKDLQTFLFGKGLDRQGYQRTNERLAVLGEDFFCLNRKKYVVDREFPTGAFRLEPSASNRILPTEYVDIVTLNKHRMLSIIELKLNDSQLEVISQLLDYAIFFRSYIGQLKKAVLEARFGKNENYYENIICYVANNRYHPRFDDILKYYSTKNRDYGFELKKIVLGATGCI